MICSPAQLAEFYGVDPRTVTNWINSEPPCPSWKEGRERKFDTAKVAEWYAAQAVAKAVANISREPPTDLSDAERRKAIADAQLAEIRVAKEEGELIPKDIHESVVADLCDRLRAVALNISSSHSMSLERLGVPPAEAQTVLDTISDSIMQTLQNSADGMEDDDDAND
jgi:phage terminase Nu1 subunit (DNA packaging protein)